MKDTQELPRMMGVGGEGLTDSEGPSRTEEETPTGYLLLGGGWTGAWRDRKGPDGRGGFVTNKAHSLVPGSENLPSGHL